MENFNYAAFNEQEQVLKMLAIKLNLDVTDGDYIRRFYAYFVGKNYDTKFINNLSKMIGEYIKEGNLNNWLKENINNHSIEELMDIEFFWESYVNNLNILGKQEPVCYTDKELAILNIYSVNAGHIFENSICDFHESRDEDDNGDTVFSYTDTRRYM